MKLVLLLASFTLGLQLDRFNLPQSDQIYVLDAPSTQLASSGDACPQGTVTYTLSESRKSISLDHSAPAIKGACHIQLRLHYPQGWQYTVSKSVYSAAAQLPQGAQLDATAKFAFAGDESNKDKQWSTHVQTSGPTAAETLMVENAVAAEQRVWSACGSSVTLNVDESFDATNGGQVRNIAHKLALDWRRC